MGPRSGWLFAQADPLRPAGAEGRTPRMDWAANAPKGYAPTGTRSWGGAFVAAGAVVMAVSLAERA